jgi:hypothetical protein
LIIRHWNTNWLSLPRHLNYIVVKKWLLQDNIEVPAPTKENEWLCICVLRVSNIPILFWKWFDSVLFLVCHFTIHNNYTDSQKTLNSQRTQGQLWRKSRSLCNLNMYEIRCPKIEISRLQHIEKITERANCLYSIYICTCLNCIKI